MIRHYTPDPDALATAIAARVDQLEHQARRNHDDLTALGRGVAELTAQIRALNAGANTTASGDPGDPDDWDAPAQPVQPDWLAIVDVHAARLWLGEIDAWSRDVLTAHGVTLTAACWALHPDVVALLLALQAERHAAYTGPQPTPVSEWLTRWLPAAATRISESLAACTAERGHRHDGRTYDITGLDLPTIAAWWALDRTTPAVIALQLAPLT